MLESEKSYLKILEIEIESPEWADIRRAYTDLIKVWHPDRFGSDERLRNMAVEKTKEINRAYEELKRIRKSKKSERKESNPDYGFKAETFSQERRKKAKTPFGYFLFGLDILTYLPRKAIFYILREVTIRMVTLILFGLAFLYYFNGFTFFKQGKDLYVNSYGSIQDVLQNPALQEQLSKATESAHMRNVLEKQSGKSLILRPLDSRSSRGSGGPAKYFSPEEGATPAITETGKQKKKGRAARDVTPALIQATIGCHVEKVAELLLSGADINENDVRGDSALAWAAKRRCLPVAKLLISKGADIHSRAENGFTPFVWAKLHDAEEIMTLLQDAGAEADGEYISKGYWPTGVTPKTQK